MEICGVSPEDYEWLLKCRNDPVARMNSFNTDKISRLDHYNWINESLAMFNRKLLIFKKNKKRVAVVRLDVQGIEAIISINIHRDFRNKGFAKEILALLEVKLRECSNIGLLTAKIKRSNSISCRVFHNAGYNVTSEMCEMIIMQKRL